MKLIYDPLYGYIEFEDYLIEIIDTPEFQRLRNIKQLGCASYVFPSATHTRFEHSLGVSYLCGVFINKIKEKHPELKISDNDIRRIKIAGLIHDLGHACYSHFFDNYYLKDIDNELKEHEKRSIYILKYIIKKYNLKITNDDMIEIEKMVIPDGSKGFLYQIVCNEESGYDCDKLDYINRDCLHLGLPYKYHYSRILKQIKIIDNDICFPIKQILNVYELFELRFKLHQQVYQHPVISSFEMMILDIFKLSNLDKKEYIEDVEKFILLTDDYINYVYLTTNNERIKEIYNNIKLRKLYKLIEDSDNPNKYDNYRYKLRIKINFGKEDKNPLDYIHFYENNQKIKVDPNKYIMLVPSKYETIRYRYIN